MFRKNILLVDSDPGSSKLIVSLLYAEHLPVNVVSACSLEEARRQTGAHHVDLIVLDYCFEDGTGVEFCRELYRKGSTCPVVFLTALSREVDKRTALANGCSAYLIKPDDIDRLVPVVTRQLRISLGRSSVGRRRTGRAII